MSRHEREEGAHFTRYDTLIIDQFWFQILLRSEGIETSESHSKTVKKEQINSFEASS